MAHVDLRRRRYEGRDRETGRPWRVVIGAPRASFIAGLILAVPVVAVSYTVLAQVPSGFWVALACWLLVAALLFRGAMSMRGPRGWGTATMDFGAEKSLLLAIRDAGGAITPVGAALETPLTVDEADGILLRLANDGHLRVESHDGTLYYVLPAGLPPDGPLGRA